ncbi:MAG: UTRA domain-containing protein [Anaerolineales bacterium]|nr:UTRA domain-containing protein [Anaerolineales bacterium]
MTEKDLHSPDQKREDKSTEGIPLYMQIAEGILNRISSGELKPGDRLPTERDLSRELEVNRQTIRRALRALEAQGMIIRRQGAGTFIAEPHFARRIGTLSPTLHGELQPGYKTSVKLVLFERGPAKAPIAADLHIPKLSPVYLIHRLRLIDDEPIMLEQLTLPARLFPNLERFDFTTSSLYHVLAIEFGTTLSHAQISLKPVIAGGTVAGLLGIGLGDPLILEHRVSFDTDGNPVERAEDLYRGDRVRFVSEFPMNSSQ